MNINLKPKNETKHNIGVAIYESDKKRLEEYAQSNGMTVSLIVRSLINDLLDSITNNVR